MGINHNADVANLGTVRKDTMNIWVSKLQHCTVLMGCDCRYV